MMFWKEDKESSEDRAAKARKGRDSFLETIESFIIAFILAFVFRAYVVEAFVIPTGSMAPKLNGEHYEFVCADCGYDYNVGTEPSVRRPPPGTQVSVDTVCPLCFGRKVTGKSDRFNGDRILVLKYFYDLYLPQRWDVVVFKYPYDPKTNYIKRLVGLPSEQIEIRNGDVYVNGAIARKPDAAQQALWMPVSDTNHWDKKNGLRWTPQKPDDAQWQLEAMPLTYTPRSEAVSYLVYHQVGPDGGPAPIGDFYAYDNPVGDARDRNDNRNIVPDLQLQVDVELAAAGLGQAQPPLVELVLGAYGDTFRFLLPAGQATLPVRILRNDIIFASALAPAPVLPYGQRTRLEVACVDQKLMLTANGRRFLDVNQDGQLNVEDDPTYDEPTVPASRWSGLPQDATRLMLGVQNAKALVHRLCINRDIYYTSDGQVYPKPGVKTAFGIVEPYKLKDSEYFMLGDNSPRSKDSRWWYREAPPHDASPVVRSEDLVGKAFFVYWPAAGLRYGVPKIGQIPDFTEFRLIK